MRLTIEIIKEKCKELGIECLSDKYIDRFTKLKFKCKCGNQFERVWNKVKNGRIKCSECSGKKYYTIGEVKLKCQEWGIECLSETYKNEKEKLLFKCNCGEIFERTWSDVKHGGQRNCLKCKGRKTRDRCAFTIEEIREKCKDLNITCLSSEYVNAKTFMRFKCKCGNEFCTTWDSVKSQNKVRCDVCTKKISFGELKILNFLQENNINFKQQYKIKGCRDKKELPFDFAVFDKDNNLKLLVEFDGRQHYEPWVIGETTQEKAEENLANTKRRDNIKTQFCLDNNIKLIRIPHWDINNIETILKPYVNI